MAATVFSTQLQKLRKTKGIKQEQLAEHLGVSTQAVSKWENGSYPDGDLLPRIAEYFEVSIDYLYGNESKEMCLEQQVQEYLRKKRKENENEQTKLEWMKEFLWAMQGIFQGKEREWPCRFRHYAGQWIYLYEKDRRFGILLFV